MNQPGHMSCLPDGNECLGPDPMAVSGIFILCLPAGQMLD